VGTYTFYITQTIDGCTSDANTVNLTINPLPLITLNTYHASIDSGEAVTLIAYNASQYSWSPPAGLSSTVGPIVTASPANTTTYVVTGTNSQGCQDTASCIVEVGYIHVDENSVSQYLSVYPNPTDGTLTIKYRSASQDKITSKLLDLLSQPLIIRQAETISGVIEETIDLSSFADGMYYLQIETGKGVINKKIVVRHKTN
jgi:hypothetical protein